MGIGEILLIGVGLSMDAVAVSMTNGMVYKNSSRKMKIITPLFFGAFQALMPLLGFLAGSFFADIINQYSGIVVLLILGFIGVNMIVEGIKAGKEAEIAPQALTFLTLLMQSVATSIDAFAVGVGFSALYIDIVPAVLTIGITTAALSALAIVVGKKFGDFLGGRAQILGGIILIIIGIKGMF